MDDPPFYHASLTGLSDQERSTLRLLGEGHTAKSIAALTGRSISSVNESLRRARQKTGSASSRELARRIRHDKPGAEEIGLSPPPEIGPRLRFHTVLTGAIAMTIASVAALTATLWINPQQAREPKADPLLSKLMAPAEQEPRRLAELVRTETRDPAWADQAEAALRRRYASLVDSGSIKIARLFCAATACEVVGTTSERDPERVNAIWQALQDTRLNEVAREYRLKHVAIAFGADKLFAAYWVRAS